MALTIDHRALRPRFQTALLLSKEEALDVFHAAEEEKLIIRRIEDHVFIRFKSAYHKFWSPELHLEFEGTAPAVTVIHGLYGPNPTLWTFYIFLHFIMGTLCLLCGVWAYSQAALEKPFLPQLLAMGLLALVWIGIYAFVLEGRKKGKPQMYLLHQFFLQITGGLPTSADTQTSGAG